MLVTVTIKPRTFVSVKRPIRLPCLTCIRSCSALLSAINLCTGRSEYLTALHGVWSLTPWPRRFLAKAIRGPEPGAPVLEPLHLTRVLGPPPDVYLNSLLSFLHFYVFLYLSVCEALKLRSLPFTHLIYVASRYFQ